MAVVYCIAIILFAYFLGSIPFGYIIGKFNGIDIRTVGSKNIGATNVTRCVGKKAGKLCFALDFLKGLLPVLIAQHVFKTGEVVSLVVVFATIIGHIFPVFLNFKGGKGVSTAAGAIMALAPWALITALVVWVVVFLVSRYVSLASITAAAVLPVIQWIFVLTNDKSMLVAAVLTAIAVLAIFRHRSNIQRLLDGTESRFGKK
jgi:glycerol-3-phosphate acyltransferase PlsY